MAHLDKLLNIYRNQQFAILSLDPENRFVQQVELERDFSAIELFPLSSM
jgi:hypothetical protein